MAIAHHSAGRWQQADELYGRVAGIDRRNHEVLHRWALVKEALGQHRAALQLLDKTIHLKPTAALAHCHRGFVLQDLGRRREAVASLERAVRLQPSLLDAIIGLGTVHAELDEVEAACAWFDRAVQIDPRAVDALLNKGLLLETHGRLDDAITAFDMALRVAPGDATILQRKASCLRQRGALSEALGICDRVLGARSDLAPVVFERGLILAESGEHERALTDFQRAADLHHVVPVCHYNSANCLAALDRLREAQAAYRQAIALQADYAEAFQNLGRVLLRLHQPDDALAAFDSAISIRPNNIVFLIDRADALLQLGRMEEALAGYDHAATTDQASADAFDRWGNALHAAGRYDEALARFDKALAIDPGHIHALVNLAGTLRVMGRYDEALARFADAIAIKPNFADAHADAAMCRLEAGDFATGWKMLEWRKETRRIVPRPRTFSQPQWLGDEDIDGKTLLIWADHGLGDTIQFARYVPYLAARGARVILEVQPSLTGLLARMTGAFEMIAAGGALPDFDLHCPMMSLPLAFKTTLDTIPADIPYLRADGARVAAWHERLVSLPGLKVGLVWAGNPQFSVDRHRSIPLGQLAPLGAVRGVSLVSLQIGTAGRDARDPATGLTLCDWTAELHDFDDTAALVAALDLVISVDTAAVHLAGALGKTVWMPNRYDTCWRWLRDRDDSPWYPTLRLFRQTRPGDSSDVIARIRDALEDRASGRAPTPACVR